MAGVGGALVYLLLAVTPGISDLAVAVVNVPRVQALSRVTTQAGDVDSCADGMRRCAFSLSPLKPRPTLFTRWRF